MKIFKQVSTLNDLCLTYHKNKYYCILQVVYSKTDKEFQDSINNMNQSENKQKYINIYYEAVWYLFVF